MGNGEGPAGEKSRKEMASDIIERESG